MPAGPYINMETCDTLTTPLQREPVYHLAQRVESGSLSLHALTETIIGTYFFGGGWPGIMGMRDVCDFSDGFCWRVDGVSSPVDVSLFHI